MTASAEPEAHAAGLRIPDFYIVGHPKSGTTALYEMLRRHPQIFMPELKEPRWFASDLRERFERRGRGAHPPAHPRSLEEYAALFASAGEAQLVGEASPSYLRSHAAAAEIARLRPDARIIAVLREPADFLRSMHLEMVQNRVENETDLRRALEHERLADGLLRYTDRVRYVEQLRRYAQRFPAEQVLVLIYDDFRADNAGTVRRVLGFLGVDDTVEIRPVEANPSVRVRSLALDDAVRSLYAGSGRVARAVRGVGAVVPSGVRSRTLGAVRRRLVYAPPEAPDAELMLELRQRFKPEVVALGEYLGRDLVSLWGYDRVG